MVSLVQINDDFLPFNVKTNGFNYVIFFGQQYKEITLRLDTLLFALGYSEMYSHWSRNTYIAKFVA